MSTPASAAESVREQDMDPTGLPELLHSINAVLSGSSLNAK